SASPSAEAYRAAYAAPVDILLADAIEAVMTITRDHPWVGEPQQNPVVLGIEPGQDPRVLDRAREFALRLGTGLLCVWVDPGQLVVSEMSGALNTVPLDPDSADGDPTEAEDALIAHITERLHGRDVAWRFVYTA